MIYESGFSGAEETRNNKDIHHLLLFQTITPSSLQSMLRCSVTKLEEAGHKKIYLLLFLG